MFLNPFPALYFLVACSPQVEPTLKEPRFQMDMAANLYIVQHGGSLEQLNTLEGSSYAPPGYLGWVEVGDILPIKVDPSIISPVESVDAIEQAGLARAIRTDKGKQLPAFYL